jgi:hypothetical protein
MPWNAIKLVSLGCAAIVATSCAYDGGERAKHELKRADGTPVTCFEPPPEVVKKVSVATDIDASVKEIGALAKASVRGEVTPERIREKLPTDTAVYEVVHFRLCLDYANGLLTPAEYGAFKNATPGFMHPTQAERERAAKVEKELLEVQERIKPRRLTSTQRAKLADKLSKGEKGTLDVLHLSGNVESQDFATDIVEVLVATGWTIKRGGIEVIGNIPIGLKIDLHDDKQIPQASSLQLALESALELSVQARLRPTSPANTFVLIVGSKP